MDTRAFALWTLFQGLAAVVAILIGGLYLLDAFARFKYLKVRGYRNSFLAFIPFANIWASVEATYGNCKEINLYGWRAPAIIVKLWGIIFYAFTVAAGKIPIVGRVLVMVLFAMNIAVMVQVYKDMMERLGKEEGLFAAVIAVVLNFISSYKVIGATGRFQDGELDYKSDDRRLKSQGISQGPLSFVNGKM